MDTPLLALLPLLVPLAAVLTAMYGLHLQPPPAHQHAKQHLTGTSLLALLLLSGRLAVH
jgi:hypothetical protein